MVRCYNCMHENADGTSFCAGCGRDLNQVIDNQFFLACGTTLASGRYLIGLPENTGGFGIVYKAWDNTFAKMVAVKEYYPSGLAARLPGSNNVVAYANETSRENFAQGKARFLIEARKMAKFVDIPNIVDVYDCFEENQTVYMVMEYMEGMTYGQYLEQAGGKVSPEQAVNMVANVLDALTQVHKEHVLHRDINPNNIFVCKDGRVKIFDFGAAQIDGGETVPIVTPGYAPPEQYSTEYPQGVYTDIYAVGAMLYRALTGIKPEESADRLHADHVKPPCKIDSNIPRKLSNAVMRAMALKQQLRFQTAEEFRDVLLSNRNVLDVQGELARRRRKRFFQAAGVAVVLGGIGVFSWLNRADTGLSEATLTVWIPAEHDDSPEIAETEFRTLLEQLPESMNMIEFQVEAWPEAEYAQKLKEAAEGGTLPDVFDSTGLDEAYFGQLEPLDITLELLNNPADYHYLSQYETDFPEKKQIPLCFQLPLTYRSRMLEAAGEDGYMVNKESETLYRELSGEEFLTGAKEVSDTAITEFAEDHIGIYYSDTSDYDYVNRSKTGNYTLEVPGDQTVMRFDHLWSVSNAAKEGEYKDANRKKAAQWMIYYMLSPGIQNYLGKDLGAGIPLNKEACASYMQVNAGELHILDEFIPK